MRRLTGGQFHVSAVRVVLHTSAIGHFPGHYCLEEQGSVPTHENCDLGRNVDSRLSIQ